MRHQILFTLFSLSLSVGLLSCQKSEQAVLQEAQLCLNNTPASEALNCVSKLATYTTESAYQLRCSAIFIYEGYGSASFLIQNLDKLNSNTSGAGCSGGSCSSTLSALSVFNFSSGDNTQQTNRDKNVNTANDAFDLCSKAGLKSYYQMGSLFKLGTVAAMEAYKQNRSPANLSDLETVLPSLPKAMIGEIASETYTRTCTSNISSESVRQMCTEFSETIGSDPNDYASIGCCLKQKLDDPNATCVANPGGGLCTN